MPGLVRWLSVASNAQPHDAIMRSKGAWGTSLNKRLAAIWIRTYIWKSWKTIGNKYRNLRKLGTSHANAMRKPYDCEGFLWAVIARRGQRPRRGNLILGLRIGYQMRFPLLALLPRNDKSTRRGLGRWIFVIFRPVWYRQIAGRIHGPPTAPPRLDAVPLDLSM